MKKLISLVASLSMMLSSVGASCFAESVNKENQEQTVSEVEKNTDQALADEKCTQEEAKEQNIDAMCEFALNRIMQGIETDDLKNKENALKNKESELKLRENEIEYSFKRKERELKEKEESLKYRESWLRSGEEALRYKENLLKIKEEVLKANENSLKIN